MLNESTDADQRRGLQTIAEAQPQPKSGKKRMLIAGTVIAGGMLGAMLYIGNNSATQDPVFMNAFVKEPTFQHYNPYTLSSPIINTDSRVIGQLKGDFTAGNLEQLPGYKKLFDIGNSKVSTAQTLGVDIGGIPVGVNNKYSTAINFDFSVLDYTSAKLTIGQDGSFSIPESVVNNPGPNTEKRISMLGLSHVDDPFSFKISGEQNESEAYISTTGNTMVFSDKYIQMDFTLPSQKIYGFGERVHSVGLGEGAWTMWGKNQVPVEDDGTGKGFQNFGVHPFIMFKNDKAGDFGGIFFRNSNNQAPIIKFVTEQGNKVTNLSYITTGSKVEAYFFIASSAESIIQQYQGLFGKPALPPFWAFGWQQCSDQYITSDAVDAVIKGYSDNQMPLDAVCLSHGAMDNGKTFTIDNAHFMGTSEAAILSWNKDNVNGKGKWLISTIHPAVPIDENYDLYNVLLDNDGFLKSIKNKENSGFLTADTELIDQAFFVDFHIQAAKDTWAGGVEALYSQVRLGGVSIEFDGPYFSAKCNGECPTKPPTSSPEQSPNLFERIQEFITYDTAWYKAYDDQDAESTYKIPFSPGYEMGLFDERTISLNATTGTFQDQHRMWDMKNLYGLMIGQATYKAMTDDTYDFLYKDDRPFVASQSTFSAASGQYNSHYIPGFDRDISNLRHVVSGMLNMNIFGVPMSGVDVCGSHGTLDDKLCASWYQIAAFQPLARNNYIMGADGANEPFTVKDAASKTKIQKAMQSRYQILRYMHTKMYEIFRSGGTLVKPAFFYYPDAAGAYLDYEQDFFVGPNIKVTPLLEVLGVGVDTIKGFFPGDAGEGWVNVFDFETIIPAVTTAVDPNQQAEVTPSDTPPAFLRPGSLIVFQATTYKEINPVSKLEETKQVDSTRDLIEKLPVSVLINPDKDGYAEGSIIIDDGISLKNIEDGGYDYYGLTLNHGNLLKTWKPDGLFKDNGFPGKDPKNQEIESIVVLNQKGSIVDFACYLDEKTDEYVPFQIDKSVSGNFYTLTTPTTLRFQDFSSLAFGNSAKTLNLCGATQSSWKVVDMAKLQTDLAGHDVTFELENFSQASEPHIEIRISALEKVALRVSMRQLITPAYAPYVPEFVLFADASKVNPKAILSDIVQITSEAGENWSMKVLSSIDNTKVIFDTSDHELFISQYYITWGADLLSKTGDEFNGAYGLGERVDEFFLRDGTYSFWNRDSPNSEEAGSAGDNNYGTHPYFAYQTSVFTAGSQGSFASAFMNNAAANDAIIENDIVTGKISIQFKSVGGNFDLYIDERAMPDDLVASYQTLVGNPVLVPEWLLGFNQCRWGYKDTGDLTAVIDGYAALKIPLDTMWSDIDYMDSYEDFTVDPVNYVGLGDFVTDLHTKKMHYIPIVDAGIAKKPAGQYPTYDNGVTAGVYIMGAEGGEPFVGRVWPGDAVFVDWSHPQAAGFWQAGLDQLHTKVNFDGLWLDMNEASNFCNGACEANQRPANSVMENVPYIPTGRSLNNGAIGVDAKHHNNFPELDYHNIYGFMEVKATHDWFTAKNERPTIISRSSFAGQGKFGSKWLGDNYSDAIDMSLSVPGIMMMNMLGIPIVGADICGFTLDTTPELCARWTMLGAYYPFARNHDHIVSISQEPYQPMFDVVYPDAQVEGTTYRDIIIGAIKQRYQFIPYLYSHVHDMHQFGGSYFKPLFFNYPNDRGSFKDNFNNFMLGDDLKVGISTQKLGVTEYNFYFPTGLWCPLFHYAESCINTQNGGQAITLPATADMAHVHIAMGSIVPIANTDGLDVLNTDDLRTLVPTDLHIAPKSLGFNGYWSAYNPKFFNDNGESTTSTDLSAGDVNLYQFYAQSSGDSRFEIQVKMRFTATKFLDNVTGCFKVSQRDFLRDIYVHNAPLFEINEVDYQVYVINNDGSVMPNKQHPEFLFTASYEGTESGQNKVLKLTNTDPKGICMNLIDHLTILKSVKGQDTIQSLD